MRLEIRPADAPIGAEVLGIEGAPEFALDATAFRTVSEALHTHRVLVLRGPPRPDAALVSFAERFGDLITLYEHGTTVPGFPAIVRVSNIREHGVPIGLGGEQELPWHHDHSYLECPARESFLEASELPDSAPRTCFVDMVAALEGLPPPLRARLSGLRVVHHIDERTHDESASDDAHETSGVTPAYHDATNVIAQARIASLSATHPIIARHPLSGAEALYVSPLATSRVVGMSRAESKTLLDELFERAIRPDLTYEHVWSPGDLVVFDAIGTLHRRDAFHPASRRLMKQMSTRCGEPLEAAA